MKGSVEVADGRQTPGGPSSCSDGISPHGGRAQNIGEDLPFMGNVYLPDLMPSEVMVARVTIASTTQDVTCVYARRTKNRIHFHVVEEYSGDTLSGRNTRTSRLPLSRGELEKFVDDSWPLFDVLEMNLSGNGYDVDQMQAFVVGVELELYWQLLHHQQHSGLDRSGVYPRRVPTMR